MGFRKLHPRDCIGLCASHAEKRRLIRAEGMVEFVELGAIGRNNGMLEKDLVGLYHHLFPNPDERTPWRRIVQEISAGRRKSRLRALAALRNDRIVGFCFFKNIETGPGEHWVAIMYTGAADREYSKNEYGMDMGFRGLGIATAFNVLAHAVALEDAGSGGRAKIAGAISDCEMIGQGKTPEDIRFTRTRLDIHAKTGKLPLMLEACGKLLTSAVQPALRTDSNPLLLHLLFKPFSLDADAGPGELDLGTARKLVGAYISALESDGYSASTLAIPKMEMLRRVDAAERAVLMRPQAVPDIVSLSESDPMLKAQVQRDYGDAEAHGERIAEALSGGKSRKQSQEKDCRGQDSNLRRD